MNEQKTEAAVPVPTKQAIARTEHELLKPHRHGGKDCQAGDTIKLRPDQVTRLRAEGKIK